MIKHVLLVIFCIMVYFVQSQHNHEHTFKYINPKYSPNGELILASAEGYLGIYILDAKTLKKKHEFLIDKPIGYGAAWFFDSNYVVFREKENYTFKTKKLNIKTGQITQTLISPLLLTCKSNVGYNDVAHLNQNNLIQFGEKVLGNKGENYYHVVSNANKTVFVAHLQSQIVLVDVKNNQLIPLTWGLANAISNDGNYIYFFRDYSTDGHTTSNAELFVYDIKNQKETQLTNTQDKIECWPDISPDGKTIIYSDDKTGKIEKIKVSQVIK